MNAANPQISVKPSLYGVAKPGEMVTLSVVDAAGGREKVVKRPFLGVRFYGGVVVGMGLFAIAGLIWMGINEPSETPVASVAPVKPVVAKPSVQTVENKQKKVEVVTPVASAASASKIELVSEPPVMKPIESESQPSVTAVLGPISSSVPSKKFNAPAVVEKPIKPTAKEAKKEAKKEATQTAASKNTKSAELASVQSKPAASSRKRDPDVDLIEAVISRIGQK